MKDIALLDAVGQAELVRRGEVSAIEVVESAIERIERLNPTLNAVVTPMFDQAVEQVRDGVGGPLGGVPYLVKDLIVEVRGVRFTEGSRFLAQNVSTHDSELVVRLPRSGLVIVGKTNTPEFGMAPACEPLLFGATPTRGTSSAPRAGRAADRRLRSPPASFRRPMPTISADRSVIRRQRAGCSD
jgi:amidase